MERMLTTLQAERNFLKTEDWVVRETIEECKAESMAMDIKME